MNQEMKKLYRSKSERVIAGVAGELGEYSGTHPVLFKILFVFLILWGGAGILFYLILMFIIPSQDGQSPKDLVKETAVNLKEKAQEVAGGIKQEAQEMKKESWWSNRRNVLGVVIMLSGLVFLLNQLFPIRFLKFNFIWPIVIMLIGFFVILKRH